MEKRGPERKRFKLDPRLSILLALTVFILTQFFFTQERPAIPIAYGKIKALLGAPENVVFRNIKVDAKEITGEIYVKDRISGVDPKSLKDPNQDPTVYERVIPWKSPRIGVERDDDLYKLLDKRVGGDYTAGADASPLQSAVSILMWLIMMIGTLLLSLVLVRWLMGGTTGSPFGFGRSRHQVYQRDNNKKVTFDDVAGIDEAKTELLEVVDFLRTPEKYTALGGRIPKGVLLVGPPGTGKTLLARSVAGEARVPFFSISGSDFVEMFVGVGASRVRDLFRDAVNNAPCIIFIDELDALGKSRSGNAFTSHEEREQTLNQLLVEMDGFDPNRGVIIMAATNRPEVLDAALLRPGRFDRTVVVDRPDIHGREAILKVHARNVKLSPDVKLHRVAALTPGSVGADLANLVNEAALLAARRGRESVTMKDFDEAVERGAVGLERRSRIMRPEEKRRVAIHESGHALVACAVPGSDPVHKVSIIPRGLAGGYVLQRPEGDRMLLTQGELEARIKVALGGTVAEELTLGDISTGATSDLAKANEIATRMVKEFGMSRLGRIYHNAEGSSFLPGLFTEAQNNYSEETAREIDLEVRGIIDQCLESVRKVLSEGHKALEALSIRLIEVEVIEGSDLLKLLNENGFQPNEAAKRSLLEPHSHFGEPSVNGEINGTPPVNGQQ
jgi:cell division protease FtsH